MGVKFAMIVVMMSCMVVVMFIVVVVMMRVFFFGFQWRDALRGFGVGHMALFHRAQHFAAFQAQAVKQHQFCGGNFFHIAAG